MTKAIVHESADTKLRYKCLKMVNALLKAPTAESEETESVEYELLTKTKAIQSEFKKVSNF